MDKKIDLIAKLFITYIFILALCFLVYSLVVLPTSGAEKVNAIIGLLGWSATIFAPVAAFFLLDSWKDQTKYNEQLALMSSIIQEVTELHKQLHEIRHNQSLGIYLCNSTKYLLDSSLTTGDLEQYFLELKKQFPAPESQNLLNTRKRLLDLMLNLKLYANNDNALSNISNSIILIEKLLVIYFAQLRIVYSDQSIIVNRSHKISLNDWIQKVFNLSYHASVLLKEHHLKELEASENLDVKYSLLDDEIDVLHQDIVKYRRTLD